MRHRRRRFGWHAARSHRLQAQGVSTPGLTAAFIFSFVKFTTWPADALREAGPIVICVSGNDQVADCARPTHVRQEGGRAPARWSGGRTSTGRLTECHVVFAASLDRDTCAGAGTGRFGHPILTVSDLEDFAEHGGVANFFIDGGRMRFAVNPDAAERRACASARDS